MMTFLIRLPVEIVNKNCKKPDNRPDWPVVRFLHEWLLVTSEYELLGPGLDL